MELLEPATNRRRQTRSSIFQYLYYQKQFCSKQSIAADLKLSLPTVYQNLTELMDAGFVGYSGEHRSTGGRRAMGLEVVADARLAVGISVSDDRVRFSVVDLRLQELCYRRIDHRLDEDLDEFAHFLASELEDFLDEHKVDRSRLLGVGIALPGIIDPAGDYMVMAPTLHLKNVPLRALRSAIPYPVHIQNDASCGGHAEWFMRRQQKDAFQDLNIAYISLENGVGGAILMGGQPYLGKNSRSGEFGHIQLAEDGPLCSCGKRGCLEAYCSAHRFSSDLGCTLDEFFEALKQGNRQYDLLWNDMLRHLASAINSINTSLDCDVVLGGFLSTYFGPYWDKLQSYVADGNPFTGDANFVHLSILKSHGVSLGAALYFIQRFVETV